MLAVLIIFTVLTVLAYLVTSTWGIIGVLLTILLDFITLISLISLIYLIYVKWLFSPKGRNIQNRIRDLLLSYIKWNGSGKVLDIGCGNGALSINLVKQLSDAEVTGIDYWGGSWGYSQKQCEANADIEGVSERTRFIQASASRLPFADETFDLAVSNLVFHEVSDADSKVDVVKEGLRVVKKGGSFAFQDLFLMESYYGPIDQLLADLEKGDLQEVHFEKTSNADFIPKALKLPFMVGTMGVIYGIK